MAQICRLEAQMEIKSSATKFYDVYKNQSYLLPKISPNKMRSVEILEGDGKSVGSVRLWTYDLGGAVIAKDKIIAVDEGNKSIAFDLLEGEVTKYFTSFKATLQAISAEPKKNFVKWTLEYEKAGDYVPTPHSHVEFLANVCKEQETGMEYDEIGNLQDFLKEIVAK